MSQLKKFRGGKGVFRHWAAALVFVMALLALAAAPALAQSTKYLFSVPKATADVFVNEDGTVSVEYDYLFQNDPSADPIDAVDVGVPTRYYDLSSVTATIDGQAIGSIEESPYVKPGVALNLGRAAIPPGQTGEMHVRIGRVERMLFKASAQENEPYASFQFQPNYFGSEFVTGKTDLTVTLHLPKGLKENEPRYFTPQNWPGAAEPQSGFDAQDRVFYTWQSPDASSSARYTFGASFPVRLVPEGVLLTETPVSGFNFSDAICPLLFCLGFGGFVAFVIYASIVGNRKRKLDYLPPKVSVEGNGIKRGLTAVEAALLMQEPMDKILTMVLFAVVKKNAVRVVTRDPMKLEILQPQPADLHTYESQFVAAMAHSQPRDQRADLQEMMTSLVQSVSEKMRGFSRKETIAYYQDIMNKAWQQVEQAQTPEMKMKSFDEAMDWTMLDRRFNDRTREVFGPRPVILPPWWGYYDPTYYGGGFARPSTPTVSGPSVSTAGNRPPEGMSMPNLPGGDFAASLVGGMQSFASNVVGDVTAFTGGVTQKTNPPPPPSTTRGGGGGGGRSCACACACAGCACACAGGGR